MPLLNFITKAFIEPLVPPRTKAIFLEKRKVDNALLKKFGPRAKRGMEEDGLHWALLIDGRTYQLGVLNGEMYVDQDPIDEDDVVTRVRLPGTTQLTHAAIRGHAEKLVKRMDYQGGYNVLTNNCQVFANHLYMTDAYDSGF